MLRNIFGPVIEKALSCRVEEWILCETYREHEAVRLMKTDKYLLQMQIKLSGLKKKKKNYINYDGIQFIILKMQLSG